MTAAQQDSGHLRGGTSVSATQARVHACIVAHQVQGTLLRRAWAVCCRRALWGASGAPVWWRVRVLASSAAPGQGAGCDATCTGAGEGAAYRRSSVVTVAWRQPVSGASPRGALCSRLISSGRGRGSGALLGMVDSLIRCRKMVDSLIRCRKWLTAYSGVGKMVDSLIRCRTNG